MHNDSSTERNSSLTSPLLSDEDPTEQAGDWTSLAGGNEENKHRTSATSMGQTTNAHTNHNLPSRTLNQNNTDASFSFSSTSSMGPAASNGVNDQLRRRNRHPQVPLTLPLSMRLMKQVAGLCCLDCATNKNSNNSVNHRHGFSGAAEEEPDLSMLLNYDLQALYCQPLGNNKNNSPLSMSSSSNHSNTPASVTTTSAQPKWPPSASPLVLAPMTMSVVEEEEQQPEELESNQHHYQTDDISEDPDRPRHVTTSTKTQIASSSKNQNESSLNKGHERDQTSKINNTAASPTSSFLSSPPSSPQLALETPSQGLGPSQLHLLTPNRATASVSSSAIIERIVSEYIAACRFYGVGDRLNAGVLTTLRFSLPCMRITGRFHDADMLALAEILLKYCNGPLRYIRRLDFSLSGKQAPPRWSEQNYAKGMHSHGAFTLAKVLQASKYIEEVFLNRNRIGPYGASAIFIACSTNQSIKKLMMRRCRVFERGALVFAELVASSESTALQEIDLSANYIGIKGSMAIERALLQRMNTLNETTQEPLHHIEIDLEGNHVSVRNSQ